MPSSVRSDALAGVRSVAPMLFAVIPFGLVAGATPVTAGLGGGVSIGFSTIVFAGASQLAAADTLADGGSALVAVLAACTINLRMLLYSASLSPHLADVPLRKRLLVGYLMTDQAYAVSIARFTKDSQDGGVAPPENRVAFYLGGGLLMWTSWQVATITGVLIGAAVPESLPLDFAVPLVFLVLLVPAITTRPALVAATVGGLTALIAAEVGPAHLEILFGAVAGIAAGAYADLLGERRSERLA